MARKWGRGIMGRMGYGDDVWEGMRVGVGEEVFDGAAARRGSLLTGGVGNPFLLGVRGVPSYWGCYDGPGLGCRGGGDDDVGGVWRTFAL